MEVIKTGKLHAYIGPDNYIYTRSSCRRNVTYYSCRKKDCLGRANVRNGEFKTTEPHGHPVDLELVKKFRFRHRLQMRAAEETLSIAEIYKQEASAMGGIPGLKLKSVNRGMYRARHGELPPPPKSINELATILVDDKWKEKMLYSYGEEKEEFFKACLQSEDGSTQIIFMSPTFEDFARTGAPLRLHMDSAFKIKPACGEGTEYVALHMYIGTILYPFVHMFTSLKSYYAYFSLMKYISDFIPNLNVEIFVSNDQESIEAAYTVFPKAVKSYYQPREKDKDSNHKKETDLSDVELFNKDFTRRLWPKPGVWRFMETLKEIDYDKLCYFYKIRNKKPPNRYPKKTKEVEIQTDPLTQEKIKVNSEVQTIPPTNIKKYFSEFKPFVSLGPSKSKSRVKRGYLSSSTFNQKRQPVVIQKSILKKNRTQKNDPVVIKRIKKSAPKQFITQSTQDENIYITTINSKDGETMELEVLLDNDTLNQSNDETKKPIILRRKTNSRASSDLELSATEALSILKNTNDLSSRKSVVINPKLLSNAKIVSITKLDESPSAKQKRKDQQVIERQLAEMEGTEIIEGEMEEVLEEDEVIEYVEVRREPRGRKRKKPGRKKGTHYPRKPQKKVEDKRMKVETLDESLELNSDDGEIEMLELTDEEEVTFKTYKEELIENTNNEELIENTKIDVSLENTENKEEEVAENTNIEEIIIKSTVDIKNEMKNENIVDETFEENLGQEMLEEATHEEVIENNSISILSGEEGNPIEILYTEENELMPILTKDDNHPD